MASGASIRLIDRLGRVVLPREVRLAMDWAENTPVEIWVDTTDHAVVIKKHEPRCVICGSTGEARQYNHKYVCLDCIHALLEQL